jgi:hypothetical protein
VGWPVPPSKTTKRTEFDPMSITATRAAQAGRSGTQIDEQAGSPAGSSMDRSECIAEDYTFLSGVADTRIS